MAEGDVGPNLTVRDRILIHLAEYASEDKEYEVRAEVTREGLAAAVGIEPKHVPQYVRPLIAQDLVTERAARVRGGQRRRKAYSLTLRGRHEAARLRDHLMKSEVEVEVDGERTSMALRDAMRAHFPDTPILTLVESVEADGFLKARGRVEAEEGTNRLASMTGRPGVRRALERAAASSERYEWGGAAAGYREVLSAVPTSEPFAAAEAHEGHAYALFRSAFQTENAEEFRGKMEQAFHAYGDAKAAYEKTESSGKPWAMRCEATAAFARFWLASDTSERNRLLPEIRARASEALKSFDERGESLEYAKTYNQLSIGPDLLALLWDRKTSEIYAGERIAEGERAIRHLLKVHDPPELARAYANVVESLLSVGRVSEDPEESERAVRQASDSWEKARTCSEEAALLTLCRSIFGDGTKESIASAERTLALAIPTKDGYLTGRAYAALAYHIAWSTYTVEDPTRKTALFEEAFQHATEARRRFGGLAFACPLTVAYAPEVCTMAYYKDLASLETDWGRKLQLMQKSLDAAEKQLQRGRELGYLGIIAESHYYLASLLSSMGKSEEQPEVKKRLAEEALLHAREAIPLQDRGPISRYDLGGAHVYAANAAGILADLAEDPASKERALRDAILEMQAGVDIAMEAMLFFARIGETAGFFWIAEAQNDLGKLLLRSSELTGHPHDLKKAAKAFESSAASYEKPGLASRVAECQWRIAQVHDSLGNHRKAADHFRLAAKSYEDAARRTPVLQELFKDYGLYMNAWSEIEGARHHHARQEYGKAQEFYERAANLFGFTRRWSSFAPNYSAWAELEKAEELSRQGRSQQSVEAFQEAIRRFVETRRSLEAAIPTLDDRTETELAVELANATDLRKRYCEARIVLEEAEILDEAGDHAASSERYGDAADGFEGIVRSLTVERDRRDIDLIATLSRAHQTLARAEADGSPALYEQAAALFDTARDLSLGEAGKSLASARGHYCRGLEAGTMFTATRDEESYGAAVRHFEIAEDLCEKTGSTRGSQFMRANKLLFDAYVYLDRASREPEPTAKSRLYAMTERVLKASADAFEGSGQPGKQKEVLALLARAKEERNLAASLSDILRASGTAAVPSAFPMPTPTHEKPVGLDRFESADIQGRLLLAENVVQVGQAFELEMEIVNAGRGPAQLVKLEELGLDRFELLGVSEPYVREETYVDMKGRRLEPLGTEEVKLVLRPLESGTFRLRPRILYLDERGRYRAHEPEPVEAFVTDATESNA